MNKEQILKKVMEVYFEKGIVEATRFLNDLTKVEIHSAYNGAVEQNIEYKRNK
jgi:hypothetical protein